MATLLKAAVPVPGDERHRTLLRGHAMALYVSETGASLETALDVLVRTAVDCLGDGTRAAFYLADDRGTLHHVVGMPPAYARAVDGFAIGPTSLACGLAAHSAEPVITADVRKEPRWGQWLWMAEWFDYRGCWSFPISSAAGKVVGTLAIYSRSPRDATEADIELAKVLTRTASALIAQPRNARSEQSAQK